jgi:hypothetical protein
MIIPIISIAVSIFLVSLLIVGICIVHSENEKYKKHMNDYKKFDNLEK